MPVINETFLLGGNEEVEVEITVGNKQLGGFCAMLEASTVEPVAQTASSVCYRLGAGSQLRFGSFLATAIIQDANAASDLATVRVDVRQGTKSASYARAFDLPTDGAAPCGLAIFFQ